MRCVKTICEYFWLEIYVTNNTREGKVIKQKWLLILYHHFVVCMSQSQWCTDRNSVWGDAIFIKMFCYCNKEICKNKDPLAIIRSFTV